MSMRERFNLHPTFVHGLPLIMGGGLLLMVVGGLLITGPSIRQLVLLSVGGLILLLIWIGLSRGSYKIVDDESISARVMFFPGKTIRIADIISIYQRPAFGGLQIDIAMMVREKNGKLMERGLITKQGITDADFKKLIELLLSKNPSIEIGPNLAL